ncbi:type IV toxin-antitoxin system AbiEi family antitoxin [Nocardia sp. NBC_01503]|uniref:type IV toxin-antitoxin system AbiEi family antitoxin domain-containing protein n=1 Tax=Nocardia sp. NBC_01503 TaxID=2975997 RepID=UPI002E7B0C80|nr:type IV toxin-antitoxin system AbiEi family antitoxin [Nocardia sp. NBC_01503]WTL35596.1 type IV toxin-antitoxin system AbiEi family antitoxin [Nocardia sp. NBC_01503]
MAERRSTLLPSELWRAPLRTVRPQDLADVYAQPPSEVARLVDRGVLHRVAHGYYIIIPPDYIGRTWLPVLEAAAAGIASSIYGADQAIVMGISAARMLGAVPRALATAVVAVPSQHRPIALTDRAAQVRFVRRDTDALDAERVETPLGPTLVTTPEQTLLDLARRPELGNAEAEVRSAIRTLYQRSDSSRLTQLAADQRLGAALRRAKGWASHEH